MNWFDCTISCLIGIVLGFFARVAYNWLLASTPKPPPGGKP